MRDSPELDRVRLARDVRDQALAEEKAAVADVREAVRAARAAGVSYRRLAEAAGLSLGSVQHILKGRPARDPAYDRAHARVAAKRGRPARCEECGREGGRAIYDWANLTGNYDDVNDYERMCRQCHHAYDRMRRKRAASERDPL